MDKSYDDLDDLLNDLVNEGPEIGEIIEANCPSCNKESRFEVIKSKVAKCLNCGEEVDLITETN